MHLNPPDVQAIAEAVAAAIATPREWLNPEDAAAYLDLSVTWLAKLRMANTGPAYHLVGRRCLYRRTDLDAWVAEHRVKTNAA